MSGYATSARIVRATPHAIRRDAVDADVDWRPTADAGPVVVDAGWVVGPSEETSLGERWGRFRDRWVQLTFYATDPDSWR